MIPSHTHDKHNNPHWKLPFIVDVSRMDNSLAMTMHWGAIEDPKTKKKASISAVMGGFVFIVSVDNPKGHNRRYAINMAETIQEVFRLDDELKKVEALPSPLRPQKKQGGKSGKRKASKASRDARL